MANPITIPVDAYLITLQIASYQVVEKKIAVGKNTQIHHERVQVNRDIPSNQNDKTVKRAIDVANTIWAPANITFQLRKCFFPTTEAPGNVEEVSVSGFFQMITTLKIKPMGGVASLFVNRFEKTDLGGFAAEALGVCIVTSLGDPGLGKTLAHEFGHLLSLPDLRNDPKTVENNYNLMYEASRAGDKLTVDQISKARNSERVKLVYQSPWFKVFLLTQVGYSLLLGSLGRSVQVVQLDEAVPIVPAVPSLRYGSLLIARRPVQKFNEYRAMGLEYAGAVVSTRSAPAGHGGQTVCGNIRMKLTAVSLPAKEGGYLLRGGNSRRDFEGETLAKANANLLDAWSWSWSLSATW